MKRLYLLLLTASILIISCEKEVFLLEKNQKLSGETQKQIDGKSATSYPSNQMVIQYKKNISEQEKESIRNQYGVVDYKTCPCADPTLELWIFDQDLETNGGAIIEEKIFTAKTDTGLEGADFNPKFNQPNPGINPFGVANINAALQKMVSNNQNVTIAVIDTGVDYNYFGFNSRFLYNNTANTCNQDDYIGWDFVNNDNDPFDDYGHGTIVTSLISENLKNNDITYQILPIKSFDENGKGNYFDILCGFKYAVNISDVKIVNMSFGWYEYDFQLLEIAIEDSKNNVLITASAGNDSLENDVFPHYPSNYTSENILAIAGLQEDMSNINLAWFSNFGTNSVDIAAKSENIRFYISSNTSVQVSGTSYASAIASAFAGELYTPGMTPQQHKSIILNFTIQNSNLGNIKYSSYIPE